MDRKYTVVLPEKLVQDATHELGKSITETIRIALEQIRSQKAHRKILEAFGKAPKFKLSEVRDVE